MSHSVERLLEGWESMDGASAADVADAVQTVWEYHHLHHKLPPRADGIMCLCSSDIGVAKHAAKLFQTGKYGWLLFSGGVGTGPHSGANMLGWDRPEACYFRDAAIECGVPREAIITEEASTNTGDNVRLSRTILERKGLPRDSIVVVQKPFMERRAYATFKKVWPEPDIVISSVDDSWHDYIKGCELSEDDIIHIMVGDLQRVRRYASPPTEFQIPQHIPDNVWAAYERLVAAGYTHNVLA